MSLGTRVFSWLGMTGLVGVGVYFTLQTFYMFVPLSWFFHYYDIKPIKEVYYIGEPFTYEADFEVSHMIHVKYFDKMLCKDRIDGEWMPIDLHIKEDPAKKATTRIKTNFDMHFTRAREGKCYVHSAIVYHAPYFGVERVQEIDPKYIIEVRKRPEID